MSSDSRYYSVTALGSTEAAKGSRPASDRTAAVDAIDAQRFFEFFPKDGPNSNSYASFMMMQGPSTPISNSAEESTSVMQGGAASFGEAIPTTPSTMGIDPFGSSFQSPDTTGPLQAASQGTYNLGWGVNSATAAQVDSAFNFLPTSSGIHQRFDDSNNSQHSDQQLSLRLDTDDSTWASQPPFVTITTPDHITRPHLNQYRRSSAPRLGPLQTDLSDHFDMHTHNASLPSPLSDTCVEYACPPGYGPVPAPSATSPANTMVSNDDDASPATPTNRKAMDPPRNRFNKIICDADPKCADLTFERKCEWTKHMDKHDRPYRCSEPGCENLRGFTYSGGLARHTREVHGKHNGSKKDYYCPEDSCKRSAGTGFSRKENLNEHIRRIHPKLWNQRQESAANLQDTRKGSLASLGATSGPLSISGRPRSSSAHSPVAKSRKRSTSDTIRSGSVIQDDDDDEDEDYESDHQAEMIKQLQEQVQKLQRTIQRKNDRISQLEQQLDAYVNAARSRNHTSMPTR